VWCHAWQKNWVNCSVLKGNISVLRIVPYSRFFTQRTAQFTQGIPQFPQFTLLRNADITMASPQGTQPSKINKRATTLRFIEHTDRWLRTHRTYKKTDRLNGQPVLWQRTFSSVFRAAFYTVKLHSLTKSVCVWPFRISLQSDFCTHGNRVLLSREQQAALFTNCRRKPVSLRQNSACCVSDKHGWLCRWAAFSG
jgi:hypothetical protein